jgi:hypothetical protein
MKLSDMISLEKGVFQLKVGKGRWDPDKFETAFIAFAGCETELTPEKFKEDGDVL